MMLALLLVIVGGEPAPIGPKTTPRAVVSAMFEAFNRHDADTMAKLYASNAVLTSSDFCRPRGQPDVRRTYNALFAEFSDIRDDVQMIVAERDVVAVRFTAISRAGNLALPVQAMIRVRDGLIVQDDAVFEAGGRACQN